MQSQYVVPANKPRKTTKHYWWHYRWLEGRATLGACRTARLLHKGVLKHDNIERLIDEVIYAGWTSIDTSCDY